MGGPTLKNVRGGVPAYRQKRNERGKEEGRKRPVAPKRKSTLL
jgi:hypothetical protein